MSTSPFLAIAGMRRARQQGSSNTTRPTWVVHHTTLETGLEEDCAEYVPLSRESSPLRGSGSFLGMMEDALQSPPVKIETPPKSSVEPDPACDTMQDTPALEETNLPSSASQKKENSGGKAAKWQRRVVWDDTNTHTLLRVYEETWTRIKKGNLRAKDWEDLTFALNRDTGRNYNPEHTRNRIDTLKKTHKKELWKQNSTGSTPTTWCFFEICDALWEKTPKASGLAGAFDSDNRNTLPSTINLDAPIDLQEDGTASQLPRVDPSTTTEIDLEGVVGKKVKHSTKSSLGAFARTLATSIQGMTDSQKKIEEEKMALFRDLELRRPEHDEKMQSQYLANKLEIAKLFARRHE